MLPFYSDDSNKIYTIDLHGNSKKKETAPDGSPDINVFDIQQGVSINFFIKTGRKKENELGRIFHFDKFGLRDDKYDFLLKNSINSIKFNELPNASPDFYFVNKNFSEQKQYNLGFSINELFEVSSVSVATSRDGFVISMDESELLERIVYFCDTNNSDSQIYSSLNLKDNRDWKLPVKRKLIISDNDRLQKISKIDYRLFDKRYIFYHRDAIDFGRENVMKHMLKDNVALVSNRQSRLENYQHVFISKSITDLHIMETANACPNHFPLYLYPESSGQLSLGETETRTPNLDMKIVEQIAKGLGLRFIPEKNDEAGTFAPIDLLDYIYAVLHSPTYREKYKEFLKIDFPRVPYPTGAAKFWELVKLGGELRALHLMESPALNQFITQYPIGGENAVEKIRFEENHEVIDGDKIIMMDPVEPFGRVYINDDQFFQMVPTVAWNFYIGGYQPAQKWLKDRKGRILDFEDIMHYQKIIKALVETDRIMKEIDLVDFMEKQLNI